MGLADWFRKRPPAEPPGDLRQALMAAVSRKDLQAVARLVSDNQQSIRESFPAWIKVPADIRQDPGRVAAYAQTLFMVAKFFEQTGDASLLTALNGGGLFERLDERLNAAQTMIDEGRASEAIKVLQQCRAELAGMSGSAVEHFLPRVLGRLGIAHFKSGNRNAAIIVTREAIEHCRHAGDQEGIATYERNLQVMGSADLTSNGDGPAWTMNVIDDKGVLLTDEETAATDSDFTVRVSAVHDIPPEATRLHEEGRAAGERGDLDKAMACFTAAAELAPQWPYPVYDRAYTHLLRNDPAAALVDYRRTMELAPRGFFTAALSVDALTREAAGEFPDGFYHAFTTLEHMPPEERRPILEQIVERHPSFAAAWNEYADFELDLEKRLGLVERALQMPSDAYTRGTLAVKRASILAALGRREHARLLLQPIAEDGEGSLLVQAMAKTALLRLSSDSGRRHSESDV